MRDWSGNMEMKDIKKIWKIAVLLFCCAALWGMPVKAEQTEKTIRVGYPIQPGLTQKDEKGKLSGYSYEYLLEIAKYTGWQYEFVEAEGTMDEQLVTLLDMLKNGEIDIMGGMIYNERLSEIYDYPGTGYGTAYYSLAALSSNMEISSDNYYLMPMLRVAVASTKKEKNEKLDHFAQMSGMKVEQIFCDTDEEQLELLEEKKADVLLTKDIALPAENMKIITQFSPQAYYFAAAKGEKEIVNGLDRALVTIARDNPYFSANLWNKYFTSRSEGCDFSEEEKNYIKNAGTLQVVIYGGRPPIQYIDDKTGGPAGVTMDVLDFISQETGLKFETVMTESFEEYERLVKSGEMDVEAGAMDNLLQYDWQKSAVTMPYLEAPMSIVLVDGLNPEDIKGKRLAMPAGTHFGGQYAGTVLYYETMEDCMDAVYSGKADYCYANTYLVQYYTGSPERRSLISIPQDSEWATHFCMGILDPSDDTLIGILNKTIQKFSQRNLLRGYLYEKAYRQEKVTFGSYLMSNPREAVLFGILFFLAIVLLGMILTRKKDKKNQLIRKLENERYEQISEISNEFLFEYDVRTDRLKLSEKCAEYMNMPRLIENMSGRGEKSSSLVNQILKKRETNVEVQLTVADGGLRWMRITMKRIENTNGEVIYLVGKLTDVQKEREEKEKLQLRAERDSLTGVYNMATFRERVCSMYSRLKAEQYIFYIIDIDYFKQVNDTYGHYTGDLVLQKIGEILLQVFSDKHDETGRLGGDEFVAQTVYAGDREAVYSRCRRLNELVGQIDFEGKNSPVTVSIGAVLISDERDFETVYKQADKALYKVKKEGRGSFYVYWDQEGMPV